jgi:tripartite-type tricarboxylate transporter receptor subunit TctC
MLCADHCCNCKKNEIKDLMKLRRNLLKTLLAAPGGLHLAWAPRSAQAQTAGYPNRAVRIIVPFPPGGPVDTTARALAARLSQIWGQAVVVENKSGANSVIGAEAASKASPDGYTLFMGAIHQSVLPGLGLKLPYDIEKDFQALMFGAAFPIVLVVNPSVPAKTLSELIKLVKANPGRYAYSSAGNGGGTHLSGELFKAQADVYMLHIPYRGSAPAMADLLGGQVQMMFADGPTAIPQVKAGRVRALAVGSPERSPLLPEVPTMNEAGLKGYEAYSWAGLWVPTGLPKDIFEKISIDCQRAFSDSAVKERLLAQGAEVRPGSPEQFGTFVKSEIKKWSAVIKRANIKPD